MNEHNDILKALRQQLNGGGQPFSLPEHYFSELENQLLAKTQEEDELEQVPLGDEGKKPTFTVPEGYFDNVEENILKKTAPTPVRMPFSKKWLQLAAAAITGLIILGGVYKWRDTGSQDIAVQNETNNSAVIQNISITELNNFVEGSAAGNINGQDKKNPVDINQLFQQVSSQDLESFLNETAANNTELF